MSISLMTHVWDNYQQKGGRMLLMLALADYANDADQCWPSIDALSKKARLRVRQTQILLRTMADAGEISIAEGEGPHNVNRYTVHRAVLTEQKYSAKKTKKKAPKQGAENAPPAENAPRSFRHEGVHFSTAPERETVSENAPKPPLINHHDLTTTTMGGIGANAPGGDGGIDHSDLDGNLDASPPSSAPPPSPAPVAHLDTVKYLRDEIGIAVAPTFADLPLASVKPFVERLMRGGAKPEHIVGHMRRNRTTLASAPTECNPPDAPQRPNWLPPANWESLSTTARQFFALATWDGSAIGSDDPGVLEMLTTRYARQASRIETALKEARHAAY